jgi:hypothetical protein
MPRKTRYNITPTKWTCPHCGFVFGAADLIRVNFDDLRCKQCGKISLAPTQGKAQRLG